MLRVSGVKSVLLCSLVLAGCTSTADSGTTRTTEPITVTTTTSTIPEPTTIPITVPQRWEAGKVYRFAGFFVPIFFAPSDEGWVTRAGTELGINLVYAGDGAREGDLDLSVFVSDPDLSLDAAAAEITAHESVELRAEPDRVSVAGHQALSLDVDISDGVGLPVACETAPSFGGLTYFFGPGIVLLTENGYLFGFVACSVARVWFVDVSGDTIVIIAGARGPDVFEDVVPIAERLIAGIAFDDPADSG